MLWAAFLLYDYVNQMGIRRVCFFGIPVTVRIWLTMAIAVAAIPLINLKLWAAAKKLYQRQIENSPSNGGKLNNTTNARSWLFDSRTATILTALIFGLLCWIFRDHNWFPGDQDYWCMYIQENFSFHIRQPIATYYNHLGFLATKKIFDNDPRSSIAFASCLLAIPFFYLSTQLVKELATERIRRWLLLLFLLSSGAIELYFGHIESYTAFTTALLLYSLVAIRFLRGQGNLFLCALTYGMMCAVHLMGLFLGWSILFLVIYAMRNWSLKELFRKGAVGLTGALIPLLATVGLMVAHMLFYKYGLQLETMLKLAHFDPSNISTSLGGADSAMFKPEDYSGSIVSYWFSWQHFQEMIRFHLLLTPFSVFIIPLSLVATPLLSKKYPDERGVLWFLLIFNLSYLQLTFLCKPDSGWYGDWSLFAGIGFTLNLMGGMFFLKLKQAPNIVQWAGSIAIAVSMVRTVTWIITNHSM